MRGRPTVDIHDVQVVNGCYCTQLTHRVQRHQDTAHSPKNCRYEIIDNCTGTKVVNIVAGPDIYKFHDGCLRKVSRELAQMARVTNCIGIEYYFAPTTALALNYIMKPFHVSTISSKFKYDLLLFGARYGLPPRHMSRLVDKHNYADLIAYACYNNNTYLMSILLSVRISKAQLAEELKKIDDSFRLNFIHKHLEHENRLKRYGRFRAVFILVVLGVWVCLLYCAIQFDAEWKIPESKGGHGRSSGGTSSFHFYRG